MTKDNKKIVDLAKSLSIDQCHTMNGKEVHGMLQNLVKIINDIEADVTLNTPLLPQPVIRIQGAHDSMIPPHITGPTGGGC